MNPAVTVGDAMLRAPRTHPSSLTVAQARGAFGASAKTHMILLVRDGVLLGTLTLGDLAVDAGGEALALSLGSLDGRTVPPDASLARTHRMMRERGIRRLAVVDGAGRLLGLLCLKHSLRGFCTDEGVAAMRAARTIR